MWWMTTLALASTQPTEPAPEVLTIDPVPWAHASDCDAVDVLHEGMDDVLEDFDKDDVTRLYASLYPDKPPVPEAAESGRLAWALFAQMAACPTAGAQPFEETMPTLYVAYMALAAARVSLEQGDPTGARIATDVWAGAQALRWGGLVQHGVAMSIEQMAAQVLADFATHLGPADAAELAGRVSALVERRPPLLHTVASEREAMRRLLAHPELSWRHWAALSVCLPFQDQALPDAPRTSVDTPEALQDAVERLQQMLDTLPRPLSLCLIGSTGVFEDLLEIQAETDAATRRLLLTAR